ncbi:MAG: UDP-N-acetylmuramate--L-alanine ligase [Clostridia bacterium]|nr:UDP-N-acetylmuramate--L-alanine ligase [Clostridia bacterium]
MPKHVYFIGIGGSSMSGIAELVRSSGCRVSGSDRAQNSKTKKLMASGITIYPVHSSENISDDIDLVVYSAAIASDNPELVEARRRGIPTVERGEYLGQLAKRHPYTVAVSGTHGKTTTTSMISSIMISANKEPCIHIGGVLERIHNNVLPSDGDYFVTEACEFSGSFLHFYPYAAVVTNIEEDHLDYYKTFDNLIAAFRQFVLQCRDDGFAVVCGHDEYISQITAGAKCRVLTYGIDGDFDYCATDVCIGKDKTSYKVLRKATGESFAVKISVPGSFNVLNSLAACAVCCELGCSPEEICDGLNQYTGTKRRFECVGYVNGAPLIDDYAHHPTELKVTLEIAKSKKQEGGKIYAVFQPVTFSRALAFFEVFPEVLKDADVVIVTDIYAAREIDKHEITGKQISDYCVQKGLDSRNIGSFSQIAAYLEEHVTSKDMIVLLSCGDLDKLADEFKNLSKS